MDENEYDVLVVGGGIAGTGIAAHLAPSCRVAVLEMEEQPGLHSTGRSAALFVAGYGNRVVRALTLASRKFFFSPDPRFCEGALVNKRKIMIIGRAEKREAFEQFVAHELPAGNLEWISAEVALELCPVLHLDGLIGAVLDVDAADIEVHALQHGYIRQLKSHGGQLFVNARVEGATFDQAAGRWDVETPLGVFRAPILVNAAGAWADEVAAKAGVKPIGIEPRRRTAALVDVPEGLDSKDWPMVLDADESFYMKPDAGLLLISPADETLSEPEDVQPDELDVAIAADRLQQLTGIEVRRIKSKWAGLRSFVGDRSPVVGFATENPGFFWLAAQGGYGIQTAPALSSLAAKLVLKLPVHDEFEAMKIREEDLSPARLYQPAEQVR
ncbi:FAD-dependent catabolic D-arginine dehydrogenase DauA [Sphingomonas oligophenolica]|uniref:FAD-binding oxidoreductase n=1 Tax=Sphingomonas oligophenolica TaxID=301154 RepID=A0ABU9YBT8_9SPHN